MKDIFLAVRAESAVYQRGRDEVLETLLPRCQSEVIQNEIHKLVGELGGHIDWGAC
jgi:hypothetical protein